MTYLTRSDGGRLYVLDQGQGPPLLFVHGLATSSQVWRYQFDGLASRHRVVALDLPGHGDSDPAAFGYSTDAMAADLHTVTETLHLAELTLVGWSMGANVVMAYLRLFGFQRVAGVVFVEGSPRLLADEGYPGLPTEAFDQFRMAAELDWPAFARQWAAQSLHPIADPELLAWMTALVERTLPGAAAQLLEAAKQMDERSSLPSLRVPVLVVHGSEDTLVPVPMGEAIAQLVPGADLAVLPGQGHMPFLQDAAAYNKLVAEFSAEMTSSRSRS